MKAVFAISIFIIFSFSITGNAQNINPVDIKYFDNSYFKGNISVSQDSELENYFETCVGLNYKRHGFEGYRIKIFAQNNANARNQANSIRLGFEESYKKQKAYVTYVEPNFEVHVGDFVNRFEAIAFFNEISARYPEAYIIRTIVKFPNRDVENVQ